MEIQLKCCTGSATLSMEDELVETGHPLLALLDYKTNASKSLPTALSPSGKEAAALQAVVRRVVLSTPSNSKVRMQAPCGTCCRPLLHLCAVVDALSAVCAGIDRVI